MVYRQLVSDIYILLIFFIFGWYGAVSVCTFATYVNSVHFWETKSTCICSMVCQQFLVKRKIPNHQIRSRNYLSKILPTSTFCAFTSMSEAVVMIYDGYHDHNWHFCRLHLLTHYQNSENKLIIPMPPFRKSSTIRTLGCGFKNYVLKGTSFQYGTT